MSTKKETKQTIVEEVKLYKNNLKKRKAEIMTLPEEQQKLEKQKDKTERKKVKNERKQQIKNMDKDEKKSAKRHDRQFKKIKNRPQRAVFWGAVACLLVFVVSVAAPYVSAFMNLTSISIDSSTEAGIKARENAAIVARNVSDEGIVLLQNTDDFLPLEDNTLNVFGTSSFDIKYGGGGSGGSSSISNVNLYDALNESGIEYNKDLHNFYVEQGANSGSEPSTGLMQIASMLIGGNKEEADITNLSDDIMNNAKDYSNNAMIVLSLSAVETADISLEGLSPSPNSMTLLDKVCNEFDNVIVVINSGNAMELGFLEEYPSIKAALWMGTPGPYGCQSLSAVLKGDINPSGRLTDTYAYDASSAPSTVNLGDYQFDNIDNMAFLNYQEGIYVGYRYYETYYVDNEEGYKKAVQYPFGYGMSYTDFEWEVVDNSFNDEAIDLDIKVTNSGFVAGKDVVQVYFTPPYTPGGIEKSAVQLVAYAKTDLLSPNESQTLKIHFATHDMASYDMEQEQAYVLEKGDYQIRVSKNVHEPVEVLTYTVQKDIVYKTDSATGTDIANRFDYAKGDFTYLSRNDWEATYPDASERNFTAPENVVEEFAAKPVKVDGNPPTMGADNGIMLTDLKGLEYSDPKWEQFLDQFTLEEMRDMFVDGAYSTTPVERLGVPQTILLDGPAGLNSFFSSITAAAYPSEAVIATTWNDELAEFVGDSIGAEANAYNVQGWYAPGMNIHRTSMGGRNFEYFSEDPLLSGKMAAAMVRGAQSHDVLVFIKHFALNEQEINARKGVSVWANEQTLREIYLKPFEISVKESQPTAAMSSFIYMGSKWCGGNPELLQSVLRDEWGFEGIVSTDAVLGGFMDLNFAVRYGNELMLDPFPNGNRKYFDRLYKDDPVGIGNGLRDRVHTICYTFVNKTNLFD